MISEIFNDMKHCTVSATPELLVGEGLHYDHHSVSLDISVSVARELQLSGKDFQKLLYQLVGHMCRIRRKCVL